MILPAITAMSFRSSLDALERCGRDLILPSSNEIQTSLSRSSQAGQTVEGEEPLYADPASDEVPREIAGPEWPEIISHAAIRFPIKAPPDAHSDLMEIQIDTVRYHICQLSGQIAGSIVDCAIEVEMANLQALISNCLLCRYVAGFLRCEAGKCSRVRYAAGFSVCSTPLRPCLARAVSRKSIPVACGGTVKVLRSIQGFSLTVTCRSGRLRSCR